MLCVCGSHGGPDTQIHQWSSHLWSRILLKGTKAEVGMEPPIFQTVADRLHLKVLMFWKKEKENFLKLHTITDWMLDQLSPCLSHKLLVVSSVPISLQTQSQSNPRTSCQKLSYSRSIFNKNKSYMLYLTCCSYRWVSEHERPRHNVRAISLQPGQMNKWKRLHRQAFVSIAQLN